MTRIPCTPNGQGSWSQQTTLEGRVYTLVFDWNARCQLWMLHLYDVNGAAIRTGIMLTTGTSLLWRIVDVDAIENGPGDAHQNGPRVTPTLPG